MGSKPQTHTLKGQLQYRLPAAGSKPTFCSILDLGGEYTFDPGKLANSFDLMSGASLDNGIPVNDDLPWSMEMTVLPEGVHENGVVLSSFELLNTSFRSALLLRQPAPPHQEQKGPTQGQASNHPYWGFEGGQDQKEGEVECREGW